MFNSNITYKDYKNCDLADFMQAMSQKDDNVETISTEYLYILYTKFMADADQCAYTGTPYAHGLSISSKKQAEKYKAEIMKRMEQKLTSEKPQPYVFDAIENAILNINQNTIVTMTVHGETKRYTPHCNSDKSWDMNIVNNDNAVYGLSCCNMRELRALLLADYANGTITNVCIE